MEAFINRYPNLRAASRIGVAVSGGADSTFLARFVHGLGLKIVLLHMNYGLRGEESLEDERFVQTLANELDVDSFVSRVKPEGSAEDELRRLRYLWFRECGVDAVLTGHTKDDQAETLIFRILRGTGPAGLAGIQPVLDDFVYRPLLEVGRSQVRAWLREDGHPWREDSSNSNSAYRRNLIRNEWIPRIEAELNPQVIDALANLAAIAREEESWLGALVEASLNAMIHLEGKGLVLDCEAARQSPRALRRRLMRRLIERVKGNLHEVDFPHIEAALELLERPEGDGRLQIPGVDLMRSFTSMRAIRLEDVPNLDTRNFRFPLLVPGEQKLPEDAGTLRSTLDARSTYNGNGRSLDWMKLRKALAAGENLEIRNWRPGDTIQLQGFERDVKIKELFQKSRVPLWRRRSWPIAVLRDSPVWVAQFGPATEFSTSADTVDELHLEWMPSWN